MIEQLTDGRTAQLGVYLHTLHDDYLQDRVSEDQLEAALLAFANSTPEFQNLLDDWVQNDPSDFLPPLARGVYRWNLALLAQGPTSDEGFSEDHHDEFSRHFSAAAIDLATAIHREPRLGYAYSLLIHISTELGEHENVERFIEVARGADPRSHSIHRRYLESLRPWTPGAERTAQQAAQAIDAYLDKNALYFSSNPAFHYLTSYRELFAGDLAARDGDRELAARHYDRAISRAPGWLQHVRRGINNHRRSLDAEAVTDFDQALILRPQSPSILRLRAKALAGLGEMEASLNDLTLAARLDPYAPATLLELSFALRDRGDFHGAIAALNRAMEFGTTNVHVWDARGRIYLYDIQDFERARSDLAAAVALAPDTERYQFNYAAAVFKAGGCDALVELERYLGLCTGGHCPTANQQLATQWLGQLQQPGRCLPYIHEKRDDWN